MRGSRVTHILAASLAVALILIAARLDEGPTSCTPILPMLSVSYLCGAIGGYGAKIRRRRARTGILLGLMLGPFGVIIACSHRAPVGSPTRGGPPGRV